MNQSTPHISIIVPNYNHAPYLQQRLDSIFQQTYDNFEVILLDDASTDDSVAVLKQYAAHPKVSHFIANSENSGSPFKQWRKGLKLAKGKYIWIAESDDWADKTFLETVVPVLEEDDQVVLSYTQSVFTNSKGERRYSYQKNTKRLDSTKWVSAHKETGKLETLSYLIHQNTIPNASAVVFVNDVRNTQLLNEGMSYCGDWWFWIQLLQRGKLAFSPKELNYFRYHDSSTRAKGKGTPIKAILEHMEVMRLIEKIYPEAQKKVQQQKLQLLAEAIDAYPLQQIGKVWQYSRCYLGTSFAFFPSLLIWAQKSVRRRL